MDTANILSEVNQIFIEILGDESIVLSDKTTANDVEDWDSLTHVQLIVAIEKHFNIKFTSIEIMKFKNVGELCEAIWKRVAGK